MAKKISVFGDSISTFDGYTACDNRVYYEGAQLDATGVRNVQDTWWMQTIDALGGNFFTNASFSGSLVAGDGFPAGCSMARARQVLGPNGCAPDTVLIFIGINDYGWGDAAAQNEALSEAAPCRFAEDGRRRTGSSVVMEVGSAPKDALVVFSRAYELMLANLKQVAPEANLMCLTLVPGRVVGCEKPTFAHQLRGIDFESYNDAIRTAALNAKCTLLDIAAFGFDYETIDGTHPTVRGMQQISAMAVAAAKEDQSIVVQNEDLFPLHLRSGRTCDMQTCMGCAYARSTTSKWSCVCEKLR